ncbi:MAG: hypothetical protein AB4058_07935 [Microcystaceae cyanobacterium]
MSDSSLCRLVIAQNVPSDEITSLKSSLQLNNIAVMASTPRTGLEGVALIIGIGVGVANLTEYTIKVGNGLIKWVKKLKAQEIDINATLEHPSLPPLDLQTATDEEIKEWLLSLLPLLENE